MKLSIIAGAGLMAASLGATALGGCAAGYDYSYGPPPGPYADVDYDGYYDDFYGPFYGGFWGPDEHFWYADRGGRYHRDAGNHFAHRSMGANFHAIHGHAPAGRHG